MKTLESRRFVSGTAELRLFLVEEGGPLPFRVRLQLAGRRADSGVMAGFATEDEAAAALEVQAQKAVAAGWTQVPAQVRLALEIPAAPGSMVAAMIAVPAPACAHEAIQAYLPKLAAGKAIVCPDCMESVEVKRDDDGAVTAIICSRGRRSHLSCRHCGRPSSLLCDYPVRAGRGPVDGTCDAPLCSGCTTKKGGGDLCRAHAALWDEKTGRPKVGPAA